MSSAGSPSTPPPPPPPPPSGACSGWASSTVADGCAGAPPASAYTIQHPDFFSGYAQQSGQSYVTTGGCKGYANCHPPWAVAGVDYPVGVSTEGCANDSPSTCGPGTCAASGSCGPTSQYGFGNPGSATDPTVASSPNYHGNPANCTKQSVNQITCKGPTSQPVDIGPFDFSWQGNAGGVGLSISIGNAVTGPCVIHDDYFVFDFGQTYVSSIVPYVFYGCSSVTFRNDVFRTRNPTTGVLDARWPAANGGVTVFVTGPSPTPKIHTTMEYTAFITCPARCITVGDFLFQYNYFGGATMYEPPTKSPAHGDGWMASFYDATCDCANQVSFVEKFDTWLQPSSGVGGAASLSCLSCGLINYPSANGSGVTTKGSTTLTMLTINTATYPQVGDTVQGNSGWSAWGQAGYRGQGTVVSPPGAQPKVVSCPNNVCGAPGTGDYTLSTPYTITCPPPPGNMTCTYGFQRPASVTTADYENNAWVGNVTNSTAYSGPGVGQISKMWAAGYGRYQNVFIKNNYVDLCGTNPRPIGAPYQCVGSTGWSIGGWTSAFPSVSLAEGGNVNMLDGAYLSVFKTQNSVRPRSPKSPPASLLPAPTRPQGPRPRPQPRRP